MTKMLEAVRGQEVRCSVCEKNYNKLIVLSKKTGKAICYECLHYSNIVLGTYPDGAVSCLKCNHYEYFSAVYDRGAVRVTYSYTGQDKADKAIYSPEKITGIWDKNTARYDAGYCGKCQHLLPFKLVWENPYILQRKDKNARKLSNKDQK